MINTTKLDPIETASIDELQALQTARLKWTREPRLQQRSDVQTQV